jgi:hypothetical protein
VKFLDTDNCAFRQYPELAGRCLSKRGTDKSVDPEPVESPAAGSENVKGAPAVRRNVAKPPAPTIGVAVMARQLALFSPSPILPSRPFTRYSKSFDEIRNCTGSERQIVARRLDDGQVLSEFVSVTGACWECARLDELCD